MGTIWRALSQPKVMIIGQIAYLDAYGVTPQQKWREVDYFPFTVLHKKWQYHLFTMLKQQVGTRALKDKIDALWRKYAQGLVAY